jgi:hypothetical protein
VKERRDRERESEREERESDRSMIMLTDVIDK